MVVVVFSRTLLRYVRLMAPHESYVSRLSFVGDVVAPYAET